jgi:RNA polymerase sigma factor (TIGR02999 family)
MIESSQDTARSQITRLLVEWGNGKKKALDQMTPLVYDELRKLALSHLSRERNAATLQPTALVHEAYVRLVVQDLPDFESRSHFFGVAARLMRQILVDHARKQRRLRRGGGAQRVPLDEALSFAPERSGELLDLDDALQALAAIDQRKAKVIELRFFGGLSIEETAQALGFSTATVGREQRFAEAWLHKRISRSRSASTGGGT